MVLATASPHTCNASHRLIKTTDEAYKAAAPRAGVNCVQAEDDCDQPPPAYQLLDYVSHDEQHGRSKNTAGTTHQQQQQQQHQKAITGPPRRQKHAQHQSMQHTAEQRQRSRNLSLTPSVINNSNRSVTITIVCLVATFMVCNMGAVVSHTLWSLTNFSSLAWLEDYRRHIAHVSNVLTTVNSSANFVVCCLCSRLFRRTLVNLFHRRKPNSRK